MPTGNRNTDSAKKNNNEDSKSSFIDEVEKSENSMTTESGKIEDQKAFNKENQIKSFTITDNSINNADKQSDKSMTNNEEEKM